MEQFKAAQAGDLWPAAEALAAFAHHEPDTASPDVMAGALLVAEFFSTFRALVKGLAAPPKKK